MRVATDDAPIWVSVKVMEAIGVVIEFNPFRGAFGAFLWMRESLINEMHQDGAPLPFRWPRNEEDCGVELGSRQYSPDSLMKRGRAGVGDGEAAEKEIAVTLPASLSAPATPLSAMQQQDLAVLQFPRSCSSGAEGDSTGSSQHWLVDAGSRHGGRTAMEHESCRQTAEERAGSSHEPMRAFEGRCSDDNDDESAHRPPVPPAPTLSPMRGAPHSSPPPTPPSTTNCPTILSAFDKLALTGLRRAQPGASLPPSPPGSPAANVVPRVAR